MLTMGPVAKVLFGSSAGNTLATGRVGAPGSIEYGEGSGVEGHPVTGETAPDDGRSSTSVSASGSLRQKTHEIDDGVEEEEIHRVTQSVGRTFECLLPHIRTARVTDAPLQDEDSGKPDDEDTDVKKDEPGFRNDQVTKESTKMYKQAEKKTDERE